MRIYNSDGSEPEVCVDMGAPILNAPHVPTTLATTGEVVKVPLEVDGKTYTVTCVSMGNPHCVTFGEQGSRGWDVDVLPLEMIGPLFEHHSVFPARINTGDEVSDNQRIFHCFRICPSLDSITSQNVCLGALVQVLLKLVELGHVLLLWQQSRKDAQNGNVWLNCLVALWKLNGVKMTIIST